MSPHTGTQTTTMNRRQLFRYTTFSISLLAGCSSGGDTSNSDNRTRTDDAGLTTDGRVDVDATSTADPASEFDRWQRAIRRDWNAVDCACNYDAYGFANPTDCEDGLTPPEYIWECENIENALANIWERPGIVCMYEAFEALTTCLERAACGEAAGDTCNATFDSRQERCLSEEDIAVFNATSSQGLECVIDREVGRGEDSCSEPARVAGYGDAIASGTTDRAGNHRAPPTPSCVTFGKSYYGGWAPDVTTLYTATASGMHEFDTVGSTFDTVLYVLRDEQNDCNAAEPAVLACDDDGAQNGASVVALRLDAGEAVRLVVDGAQTHEHGHFVINVRRR